MLSMIAYKSHLPELSPDLIEEIVHRLEPLNPRRIVLFGSRARGTHRPDSDIDLLIIADSALPRDRRAAMAYRALAGAGIETDVDVVVYTPDETEQWRDVPAALVTTALREGKVLYEQERD